jgi:alkylated DNA nucleotide flippase Atl1
MAYNRNILEQMLDQIPVGRVTRHGLIGEAMQTTGRAVAPSICRSGSPGRIRVVFKGGWFPHQDDLDDCIERAKILEREGVLISADRRRVLVKEEEMWKP